MIKSCAYPFDIKNISKLSVCFLPVLKHSLVGYKTKKKVIQKTLFMPYLLGLGHFKLL